jgi:Zn-dependent M28 family amino/carboxypeptidase
MVGSVDAKHRANEPYIYVIQHADTTSKNDLLERAAEINNITLDYSESGAIGFFQRSDQYRFHKRGIPAIHLFSGLHGRYHRPTDTYDMLNYSLLARRIELANTFIELMQGK